MPSCAAIAPIAQHRGREPQLAGDLHQWPTAACQQGDRLRLELIRKVTPFLTHSTPFRSSRSLPKVSTSSGKAHFLLRRKAVVLLDTVGGGGAEPGLRRGNDRRLGA